MPVIFRRSTSGFIAAVAGTVSASIEGGVFTIDTGQSGSAQIYERFDKVTTNNDGSTRYDLRCRRYYLGTADGVWDIVNGFDSYDSGDDCPTDVRFKRISTPGTYYLAMEEIDVALNVSTKSPTKAVTAAVYTATTRNYTARHITSLPQTLTAGDWILDNDVTGTVTINAAGVYLNLNGHTLTHSGNNNGVVINTNATNFELHASGGGSILHSGSGYGCAVALNGSTAPSGIKIHGDAGTGPTDLTTKLIMNINSNPGCGVANVTPLSDTQVNWNGARFFNFHLDLSPNNSNDNGTQASFFRWCRNAIIYGWTATCTLIGRDGPFAYLQDCDVFGGSFDIQSGGGDIGGPVVYTSYEGGGNNYFHGITGTVSGSTDHFRLFHADRENGNRYIDLNIANTANPANVAQCISMRGKLDDGTAPYLEVGRLRGSCSNPSSAFYWLRAGGDEPTGIDYWGDMYYHGCDLPDGDVIAFYNGFTGLLQTFNNRLRNATVASTDGHTGGWRSNNDTWTGTGAFINRTGWSFGASGATSYSSFSLGQVTGGTTGITLPGVYTGYNPASDVPATPSTPTTVSGIP